MSNQNTNTLPQAGQLSAFPPAHGSRRRGRRFRQSPEYQAGYVVGYSAGCRARQRPKIEYRHLPRPEPTGELRLKNGGRVIIEGPVEITAEELERIRGWLGVHLIIANTEVRERGV